MMIFSLVAMIGLDKCCITSACLQWLCHSGEQIVARGPLVFLVTVLGSEKESSQIFFFFIGIILYLNIPCAYSLELPHKGNSSEYPQGMF